MAIDKKEALAFAAETEEIIENLRGIKGEMYTNGLLLILNFINLNKMMSTMLKDRVSNEEGERLNNLTGTVLSDTIIRVAELLYPSVQGEAHKIICKTLAKDCRILVDKQDEYSTKG